MGLSPLRLNILLVATSPNPLPRRGEGVRREIFTPLLSKSKKEVVLQHTDEKKLKKYLQWQQQ